MTPFCGSSGSTISMDYVQTVINWFWGSVSGVTKRAICFPRCLYWQHAIIVFSRQLKIISFFLFEEIFSAASGQEDQTMFVASFYFMSCSARLHRYRSSTPFASRIYSLASGCECTSQMPRGTRTSWSIAWIWWACEFGFGWLWRIFERCDTFLIYSFRFV